MKLFDVLVYSENTFQNVVFKSNLTKKKAKELVEFLRSQGKKAQIKTAKGDSVDTEIFLPQEGDGE